MIVLILCLFLAIVTMQFLVRCAKDSFAYVRELRNKFLPATSQSSSKTEVVEVAQEFDPVFSMPEATASSIIY